MMSRKKEYMDALEKQFFKLPNQLFSVGLCPRSIAAYAYLVSNAEYFDPSYSWIARQIGVTVPTARKAIQELLDAGLVRLVADKKQGRRTKYEVVPITRWSQGKGQEEQNGSTDRQENSTRDGRDFPHIQEEQEDLTRGPKNTSTSEPSIDVPEQLRDLMAQVAPRISARAHLAVPQVVATWLESNLPSFSCQQFLTELRRHYFGPKGTEIYESIKAQVETAFHQAERDRERSQGALHDFIQKKLKQSGTEAKSTTTDNGGDSDHD